MKKNNSYILLALLVSIQIERSLSTITRSEFLNEIPIDHKFIVTGFFWNCGTEDIVQIHDTDQYVILCNANLFSSDRILISDLKNPPNINFQANYRIGVHPWYSSKLTSNRRLYMRGVNGLFTVTLNAGFTSGTGAIYFPYAPGIKGFKPLVMEGTVYVMMGNMNIKSPEYPESRLYKIDDSDESHEHIIIDESCAEMVQDNKNPTFLIGIHLNLNYRGVYDISRFGDGRIDMFASTYGRGEFVHIKTQGFEDYLVGRGGSGACKISYPSWSDSGFVNINDDYNVLTWMVKSLSETIYIFISTFSSDLFVVNFEAMTVELHDIF